MGRKQEQMITQATANYYHENVVVSQMMKDALETSVEKVAPKDVPKKKKMKWYKKLLKKSKDEILSYEDVNKYPQKF